MMAESRGGPPAGHQLSTENNQGPAATQQLLAAGHQKPAGILFSCWHVYRGGEGL
jgi:hypothetical protein